jgi:hypothetical protein
MRRFVLNVKFVFPELTRRHCRVLSSGAMEGHLRLNHPDGVIVRSARVVEYQGDFFGSGPLFSWHGYLATDEKAGLLTLDDGRAFAVTATWGLLRAVQAESEAPSTGELRVRGSFADGEHPPSTEVGGVRPA